MSITRALRGNYELSFTWAKIRGKAKAGSSSPWESQSKLSWPGWQLRTVDGEARRAVKPRAGLTNPEHPRQLQEMRVRPSAGQASQRRAAGSSGEEALGQLECGLPPLGPHTRENKD